MHSPDDRLDELFESLTSQPREVDGLAPPMGGFGVRWAYSWTSWRWHSSRGKDIIYENSEGKLHRIFGPAYFSRDYDIEMWYKDGEFHRIGGPAVRHKKTQSWWVDGLLHNTNGPAVLTAGGPKEYWIEGRKYSPKEYKKEIARRKRKGLL